MKLEKKSLHPYQRRMVHYIKTKERCGLFLKMGLGKTVITLTAIQELMDDYAIGSALICAPLTVAKNVWAQEAHKWAHIDLNMEICTGTAKERRCVLESHRDVHIINHENIDWLENECSHPQYDLIVADESTAYKSSKSKRWKAMKKLAKRSERFILLTGTPNPNGLHDLWAQVYLLDFGKRLHSAKYVFMQDYFIQNPWSYKIEPKEGTKKRIIKRIKDVCVSMREKDYLDLPPKIVINRKIDLPPDAMESYKELEKKSVLKLKSKTITAISVAVRIQKLTQMANGFCYLTKLLNNVKGEKIIRFHKAKLNTLKEIVDEHSDESILIAYVFRADVEAIQKLLPMAEPLNIEKWNSKENVIMYGHPASVGQGLNLQMGGSIIIWFSLPWNLQHYEQFCARLHRQGQKHPVRVIHLIAKNTVDELMLEGLKHKSKYQKWVLDHLLIKGGKNESEQQWI